VDYNYYIVDEVDITTALTVHNPFSVVISRDTTKRSPFLLIMAHECGHLLKGESGHTDGKKSYLMHEKVDDLGGCQIQREFWRAVNK
jgi:hypothetical protein